MRKILVLFVLTLAVSRVLAQPSFTVSRHSFTRPDTVVYLNTKIDDAATYQWTFEGGTPGESYDNEVTVVYNTPGSYPVKLYSLVGTLLDSTTSSVDVPGFLAGDTVLCRYDTLKLPFAGGFVSAFSISGELASYSTSGDTVVFDAPVTGQYVIQIMSSDEIYLMYDTIDVKLGISDTTVTSFDNAVFCKGDSAALILPGKVKAYDAYRYMTGETILYAGSYTGASPYYTKGGETISLVWTDSLGCAWNTDGYSVGTNMSTPPNLSLGYKYTVCDGDSLELQDNSEAVYVEWSLGGDTVSTASFVYVKQEGSYVLRASYDSLCWSTDTATVSYTVVAHDSIISINYLPGIGNVLSYSTSVTPYSATYEFYEDTVRIDSLSAYPTSYSLLPIVVDNTTDTLASYRMDTYVTCPKPASTSASPVWLTAEEETSGSMFLSWTTYNVLPVKSYYIFRGTSMDSLQLLEKVSYNTLEYRDTMPPAGAMYAVGVEDATGAGNYYPDMLYRWQHGFITSNVSPMPENFSRIGAFAFRKYDASSFRCFLAVANGADSVQWTMPDGECDSIVTGFKTSKEFCTPGVHDAVVKAFYNGVADSLVLDDFVVIGDMAKFIVDTLYISAGADTSTYRLDDFYRNYALSVNEMESESSDYISVSNSSLLSSRVTFAQKYVFPGSDSLGIWVNPEITDTTFVLYFSCMINFSQISDSVVFVVSSAANNAPVLLDTVPEQVAVAQYDFEDIDLAGYVSDDRTILVDLKWVFEENSNLSFTVDNGLVSVKQINYNWTGSMDVNVTVTDGDGASTTFPVRFTQPYLMKIPTVKPRVAFYANKRYIRPTGTIKLYSALEYADSIRWSYPGATLVAGSDYSPEIQYDSAGRYPVTLTGINAYGDSVVSKINYIVVTALSVSDTTICKGDTIRIEVLGNDFQSFSWNTDPVKTTSFIDVSPARTTTYIVTMKRGLIPVKEQVTISIPAQPDLGADTAFCEGGTLTLSPGLFVQYYWNNQQAAGASSLDVTSAGTVAVKVVDTLGCVAHDTLVVNTLYLNPAIDLGADTTFCWKQTLALVAGDAGNTYKWSTGETSLSINADTTATYSVTVTNQNSCVASDSVDITVIVPAVPSIGVLTQSSTEKNLVAWEPAAGVAMYRVWRENAEGDFEVFDTVNKGDITVSVDNNSQPTVQSYRYSLTSVDSACGNESGLGLVHSTMMLKSVLTGANTVTLTWNAYSGINVTSYQIYRAKVGESLTLYKTVAVRVAKATTMQYVDTNAIGLGSYYQVRFNLSKTITPSYLKSDSGPYSQSLSNMAESELLDAAIVGQGIRVSPNPSKGTFTVGLGEAYPAIITLVNTLGQELLRETASTQTLTVSKSLPAGVYMLLIQRGGTVTSRQVVVQE